jgi:hypothetical protein
MNFDVLTDFRCVTGFVFFDLKAEKVVYRYDRIPFGARDGHASPLALSSNVYFISF